MEKDISYEAGIKELEKLVASLEKEELPLEKSLEVYEKGLKLAQRLDRLLSKAQAKVKLLSPTRDGEVEITDFEPEGE